MLPEATIITLYIGENNNMVICGLRHNTAGLKHALKYSVLTKNPHCVLNITIIFNNYTIELKLCKV